MQFAAVAALAGFAAAAPFSFPLKNGFPSPNNEAIALIQKEAGGTLPNTALPKELSPDVITALQLIAANEIFEVAYFTELHKNVTEGVDGYELYGKDKDFIADNLYAIRAQEELHALGANAILKNAGQGTVGACNYSFPVADYDSAIKLANTFTDIVLGLLPQVSYLAGTKGGAQGSALIPLLGSIIGQEAQQVGWFRTEQYKQPSAAPFLSPNAPAFALSAIAQFFVPNSCPAEYAALEQKIKPLPALSIIKEPTLSDQTVLFQVKGSVNPATEALTYVTGQNAPVVVAIENAYASNGSTLFTAAFPYSSGFANGLTTAAVTTSKGPFTDVADVASKTKFGPGLIEFQ